MNKINKVIFRDYGNLLINLSKVNKIRRNKNKLFFSLNDRDSIGGNALFFIGGANEETVVEFGNDEEAINEYKWLKDYTF